MEKPPEPEVFEHAGYNYVSESLDEFVRCIREKKPYPITPEDILHGVAVLEAAICSNRSSREKKPVQVTD